MANVFAKPRAEPDDPRVCRGVFGLCRGEKTCMNMNAGVTGDYWSSSTRAAGNINAADLFFKAGVVNPLNNPNRSYGLSVRCVQHLWLLFASPTSRPESLYPTVALQPTGPSTQQRYLAPSASLAAVIAKIQQAANSGEFRPIRSIPYSFGASEKNTPKLRTNDTTNKRPSAKGTVAASRPANRPTLRCVHTKKPDSIRNPA